MLVFSAGILPATLIAFALYYLIFGITAGQIGIPEIIAYNIIPASRKVFFILLYTAPLSILTILFFAYDIAHKIIGPYNRIIEELDERIKGKKEGPIKIRRKDKFWPLVDRINKLLGKL